MENNLLKQSGVSKAVARDLVAQKKLEDQKRQANDIHSQEMNKPMFEHGKTLLQ